MKLFFYALLSIIFVGLWAGVVSADTVAAPSDYFVYVNNDHIFVMLARDVGYAQVDQELRAKYNASGLYHNSDSANPLYTVDWYAYTVDVSDDGRFIIRHGSATQRRKFDELAIAFYEDGILLESYNVNDLIPIPHLLPESMSHYGWRDGSIAWDDDSLLTLPTRQGTFVFDVTTGKVVSGFPTRIVRLVPTISALLIVFWIANGSRINFKGKS